MINLPNLIISLPNTAHSLTNSSQLDLRRFLYIGGTKYRSDQVLEKIKIGHLGEPQVNRIEFLLAIKEELDSRLILGQSTNSIPHYITTISHFIRFMDDNNLSFNLNCLEENFYEYSEFLFIQSHLKNANIKKSTAYTKACTLSYLFGSILNIPDTIRLINRTRLKVNATSKKALNKTAEKQNLEATFKQGNFLVDLVAGLSINSILGSLPLTIKFRPGLVKNDQIQLYAGLSPSAKWYLAPKQEWTKSQKTHYQTIQKLRAPTHIISGKGSAKRWILVNTRVQAEFLIFLAQTGMNLTQAKDLKRGYLKYKPTGDGWQVRCYKNRKGGEVTFNIYKSYKPFLTNYISFITYFFPNSDLFFPLFTKTGDVSDSLNGLKAFTNLQTLIYEHTDFHWTSPSEIRNTRINWLLRRSNDTDLVASMAQHTSETLLQKYERPSQQRAMVEVTKFWMKNDPIKKEQLEISIITGQCNGRPESSDDIPMIVSKPNCINPSGCLWCSHYRDVDSQDYIWSLASFRHLKIIEASFNLATEETATDLIIERISKKMIWFQNSTLIHKQWVDEAEHRVSEGYYHPSWSHIIDFLEHE